MSQYEFDFDQLRCKFNPYDIHFYSEPRVLPCCTKLACLECILNDYTNGYLKCTYCSKINKLNSINELKQNESISNEITIRSAQLFSELEHKFRNDSNQSKEKKIEIINELCNKAKEDINERIDWVNHHLDMLKTDLNETLKSIKEKAYAEYNQLENETKLKLDKFNQFLNSEFIKFETTQKEMIKCQQFLNELNDLNEKFKFLYRKIKFDSSEWLPDEKFLCPSFDIFKKN